MLIETLVVGPFQSNCYILGCEETKEGIIIDPGDESQKILSIVRQLGISVTYISITHAHIDHVCGVKHVKEETLAKILLHKNELTSYNQLSMQGLFFGISITNPPPVDRFIEDGDKISFGKLNLSVIHTPGHSPGSVSYYISTDGSDILFSGDTLFAQGVGRTDLWGGSYSDLMKSIKEKILTLNENTIIYPGHGPKTTVGDEKRWNPFVNNFG